MKKIILIAFFCLTSLFAQGKEVVFETNVGEMHFTLFPKIAPKAVENFKGLVKNGYYDGTIFHRVIKNFMVQGGDPTGTGRGGKSIWGKTFKDEFKGGIVFDRSGILAMANAGPNTNGSQFFITTKPTPWLNGRHTIFGELTKGSEVLRKLESTQTDKRDKPIEEKRIIKAYIK